MERAPTIDLPSIDPMPTAKRHHGHGHSRRGRVQTDGKQFASGGSRFHFHGVTYGTFSPRADGTTFPERDQVKRDFAAMDAAGFTVVRTYTPPPDDVVELAADWGLRLLAGVFYPDWRYLLGGSRRQVAQVMRSARESVRSAARQYAGSEEVLALSLGNEVPADVVRWFGTRRIAAALAELARVAKDEDPDLLVTYANYPTAEYLPLEDFDFLTFNVYLEQEDDFRRYLTRLHHLAGDRPLVLGEVGMAVVEGADGERRQAEAIEWQLSTALERGVAGTCVFSWTDEWSVGGVAVEGWSFGLTRRDRSPRPAMAVASAWNAITVADLPHPWPSMTVVICAYNAADTLDECLGATCALDYPDLEILVVDDGSTDHTADIARRHGRARLLSIPHAGLAVARNEGWAAARTDLIVYLDSDAYPTREWPYYLALGLDSPTTGGVGGPNLPPGGDPRGAQRVARAPGGPVHVLLSDDRAEHIPGCNMAFWRQVLAEVGGFDPIYTAAGDDVDLCWKVLARGWDIGFHPAALVWHHRRPSVGAYLRQQRGYGRAEALVEARHPDRFTRTGSARWLGRIYSSSRRPPPSGRQRIYRGEYGAAAYQSVYRSGGHLSDLVHQIAVPIATLLILTLPLALMTGVLALPAAAGVAALSAIAAADLVRARPPGGLREGRLGFRLGVAVLQLMQPLARAWGRRSHRGLARRDLPKPRPLPGPVRSYPGGVLLLPETDARPELVRRLVHKVRSAGLPVAAGTGWEDHDARFMGSTLIEGHLVSSAHPVGSIQVRVRRRIRWRPWSLLMASLAVAVAIEPLSGLGLLAFALFEVARGTWNTGPRVRRLVREGAG